MMDVDQPVSSATDDEKTELDTESTQGKTADKESEMIVRESDDLPALLISDSDEDEPPKAPTEEKNAETDISGISPIETTVANANGKCDDTGNETTLPSALTKHETSAMSAVDEDEISVVENIDLTSSTEDFSVNESNVSSGRKTLPVVKAPTQSKPSSEMTAQELLESLLEAQEEAFASQRAEEMLQSKAVNATEEEKITNSKLDRTPGEIAKETPNRDAGEPSEGHPTMDTIVVDDEEMVEEPERPQETDIDEHRAETNNSSGNHDGSGSEQKSDDAAQANNDTESFLQKRNEKSDETLQCAEPPRKRARSVAFEPDPEAEHGTTEQKFHGIENDTVQNEKPLDEVAKTTESLSQRPEQLEIDTKLSANEKDAIPGVLGEKSLTVCDNSNDSSDLLNSGPRKKQCIAVGGQKNVETVKASVCPDVLVIDDDEDEAEVTSNKVQDTDDKKTEAMEKLKLQTDAHSDTDVKSPDMFDASSRSSPASTDQVEPKPIVMDFLRRFNKPISAMTRSDLEQLVLQKISEAIVHQSENAELRRIVKRQSAKLQEYEHSIKDMKSQYVCLKLVAERAVDDLKKRANIFVPPVKITRAVGLQVSRPAIDMAQTYKLANLARTLPEKRKPPPSASTATATANGVNELRTPPRMNEMTSKFTQQIVPFSSGQQNVSANVNRMQLTNNVSPLAAGRIISSSPMTNGMLRALNSQASKQNNSVPTTHVNMMPSSSVKLAAVHTNNGAGVSITAGSPNTVSAANSSASAIDSPVRKKFHKFTPKRPPLSPYLQAQQEKQAKQQQELLVQQIHEQSQQAQRKAQINVRSDLPTTENSAARPAMDAAVRQRSITPQGRPLNANHQTTVTQNYQVASIGGTRTPSAITNSTTLQLSEATSNAQTTPTGTSSGNDSLIDLTDEDDTSGRQACSAVQVKRMKSTHSGSFPSTPPTTGNPSIQNASNQFVRIVPKINTMNGSEIAPTQVGGVNQMNSAVVRAPMNANRTNNALQPLRQPLYNGNLPRLPATSTDALRKRVVIKPVLAPLPDLEEQPGDPTWKLSPPQPSICVNNVPVGIVISWTMPTHTNLHADIETYQIYAYQELSNATSQEEWRHVGDVKALLLPMAVTLTQFHEGQRYYFAVRAIDIHQRVGKFCDPRTWNDTTTVSTT